MRYKGQAVHLFSSNVETNCSYTPLNNGDSFTGVWEPMDGLPSIIVSLLTDQDGTLYLEQSADTTQVDSTLTCDVSANVKETQKIIPTMMYYRTRFVNDSGANQTVFRLQTRVGHEGILSSLLSSPIQDDASGIVARILDTELLMASGKFTGLSIVNKFGRNPDVDTGTVPEDIWDGGGVYTGFPVSTAETVQVFSSSANDTSAGTGARTIRITGLDSNYNALSETITLNGTTPVTSTNIFRRVHTAAVLTAGSGDFNAGTITCRHSTTTANVFFVMQIGRNQTNVSGYTIPAGYTGYIRRIHGSIRSGTGASVDIELWVREFGAAPRLRRPSSLNQAGELDDNIYGGLRLPEKTDVIVRAASASTNNCDTAAGYDLILVKD